MKSLETTKSSFTISFKKLVFSLIVLIAIALSLAFFLPRRYLSLIRNKEIESITCRYCDTKDYKYYIGEIKPENYDEFKNILKKTKYTLTFINYKNKTRQEYVEIVFKDGNKVVFNYVIISSVKEPFYINKSELNFDEIALLIDENTLVQSDKLMSPFK